MTETLTAEQVGNDVDHFRSDWMLHIQHPERPGEAWCGAEVLGIIERGGKVDCVVCVDLRATARRRSP